MNKLLKSLLQTGLYFLEQPDRAAEAARERVKEDIDEVGRKFQGEDHTLRYILTFAAALASAWEWGCLRLRRAEKKAEVPLPARFGMSAIELRSTFLGNATRQRGPSRRCPVLSSGALVLRDCSDRRLHRPQHVVGLSAKRTRHALWHLLRAAVGARNRKCLPAFRAGDDFLHRYLSTWPRDKCFDIPSRLRPAFPRIRFSLFQEGHKHLITSQGMMLAVRSFRPCSS